MILMGIITNSFYFYDRMMEIIKYKLDIVVLSWMFMVQIQQEVLESYNGGHIMAQTRNLDYNDKIIL